MKIDAPFNEVVRFHGHVCPGLAIGYRVAQAAARELELDRAKDEELVAVVENDACGVDAIQYMLGCTFGKGNLIHRDWGKHAFTIIRRDTGQGVRIVADFHRPMDEDQEELSRVLERIRQGVATQEEQARWKSYQGKKVKMMLDEPEDGFLKITFVKPEIPSKARVAGSIHCDECGEKVMSTKTVKKDGRNYCIPCSTKS